MKWTEVLMGCLLVLGIFVQTAKSQEQKPTQLLLIGPESAIFSQEKLASLSGQLGELAQKYRSIIIREIWGRDIQRLRKKAGCQGSNLDCLCRMGRLVLVQKVVHTELQKLPGKYLVAMILVDVETQRTIKQYRKRVSENIDSVREAMLKGWIELMGPLLSAQLQVTSNVSGADLFWDGLPLGKTPLDLTRDFEKGTHWLEIVKPGHQPEKRQIHISSGGLIQLDISLQESIGLVGQAPVSRPPLFQGELKEPKPYLPKPQNGPVSTTGQKKDKPAVYRQWWFWTVVGCAVVAGGVGLVVGLSTETNGIPEGKGRIVVHF